MSELPIDGPLSAEQADAMVLAVIADDEARQDPVATYRRLLAELPHWRSRNGMTVLTRYEDCLEYLRNPRWGRPESDMVLAPNLNGTPARVTGDSTTMLLLNPPDHTRIRSLVSRAFTPKRAEELRPRILELLTPILDRVDGAGEAEFMSELAVPFPVAVISALLGVPQDRTGEMVSLIRDVTAFIDAAADEAALERAAISGLEVATYFLELVEHKRRHPDDGLLSGLIEVESEGDRLSEAELIANVVLLYAAGFETTSNLIGNGLRALLTNPDEMVRLRRDPSLMSSAVMEVLRFDSPVQLNVRTALTDDVLFGEPVSRGAQVMILQGAANHDPAVYDRPERFDVGRFAEPGVPTPLSFGWGAHHCLGAHLARAEGEIILGEILSRFDRIEMVGPPPRYRASFTLRGLDQLNLSVSSAQG